MRGWKTTSALRIHSFQLKKKKGVATKKNKNKNKIDRRRETKEILVDFFPANREFLFLEEEEEEFVDITRATQGKNFRKECWNPPLSIWSLFSALISLGCIYLLTPNIYSHTEVCMRRLLCRCLHKTMCFSLASSSSSPPPARGGRQNLICSLVWGGNYFRQGNSLAVEIFLARGI